MPVHKSAEKRVRQSTKRRLRNRVRRSTMRTLIKKVFEQTDAAEAEKAARLASAMLDKLAKTGIIHKNKAANQKSRIQKFVNSFS